MKTVFSNDETAHVWAQQRQSYGRSGFGNVYFEGRALYSYGRHYLTGFIMPDGRALINTRNYSVSTAKHRGRAWSAASHRNPIGIHDLTAWGDSLRTLARAIETHRTAAAVSRSPAARRMRDKVAANALELSEEAGAYLLAAAGFPDSLWPRLRREAQRKADATAAKSAAACLRQDKALARELGDMSARDFAERVRRARAFGSEWRPESALIDLRDLLYSAHRNGAAGDSKADKRRRKVLWQRLKQVRAAVDHASGRRGREMREALQAVARIRGGLNPAVEPGSVDTSRRYGAIASSVSTLLRNRARGIPSATRESLLRLRELAIEAEANAQRRERAAEYAKQAEARAAWLRGEGYCRTHMSDDRGGALIRATGVERDAAGTITGGTLETSQGASVPLCHAIKAFRFLKLCRDTGRAWEANGRTIRVGHYRIDRVEPSGDFVAGCHRINWAEVERLAVELGVFALPASEAALEPSQSAA